MLTGHMIIAHELIGTLSAEALEDLQQLLLGELTSTTPGVLRELHELLAGTELHLADAPALRQLRKLLAVANSLPQLSQ